MLPAMVMRFRFDPNRCTGCQACVVGCWIAHAEQQTQPWRVVHTFNAGCLPEAGRHHLSLACHHCAEPACLLNCPARAYTQDPETGAVVIHRERCMGCRYCTWACPHDAPKFDDHEGTIEKCTFCAARLARGEQPACVGACPLDALGVESASPNGTAVAIPGLALPDTRPSIRLEPMRRTKPACPGQVGSKDSWRTAFLALPESKITLQGEWALVVFTTVLALLAAWMLAVALGQATLQPWVFLGLGAGAMGLSTLHLGRPDRAWRALLNLRHSWLSREILLVSAFLGAGTAFAWFPGRLPGLAWAVTGLGFLALAAIDRIYRVALKQGPWNLHSGQVLLNGLYLGGLGSGLWPLALGVGLLKAGLFLHRRLHAPHWPVGWTLLRVGLGWGVPLLGLALGWERTIYLASVVLGDLMDRCDFYQGLVIPTPARALIEALRTKVSSTP